jgi:hypothetical protein
MSRALALAQALEANRLMARDYRIAITTEHGPRTSLRSDLLHLPQLPPPPPLIACIRTKTGL